MQQKWFTKCKINEGLKEIYSMQMEPHVARLDYCLYFDANLW